MRRDLGNSLDPKLGGIPKRVRIRLAKLVEQAGPQTLARMAQECLGPDDPDTKFLLVHGLRSEDYLEN